MTSAMTAGTYKRPTHLLTREDIAVVIWGHKITDNISHSIRFHASKEVARQYLGNRKKNPWPNKRFDKVDWEHLDLALKKKSDMYKIWRSKQNLGFCGTRVQVGLYSGTSLPDERCPNCGRREMAAHLLFLLKRGQDPTANQQCRQTGTLAGERRHHGPGTSILDTQVHSDEGGQTFRRLGSNVPWYESSSTEPRYYRLPQLHGRAYLDSLLQNSELSPSHVQQLSQCRQLDKAIHLKNSSHHAISMDLPQHISPQQDQRVSPQEASDKIALELKSLAGTALEDVPAESKFLLEINFSNLTKSHIESQKYWILAVNAALTAQQ